MPNRFLFGAEAISEFLFGETGTNPEARVYYLFAQTNIPIKKVRGRLVALGDDLVEWVRGQPGAKETTTPKPRETAQAKERASRTRRREIGRQAAKLRWAKEKAGETAE